MPIHNSPFDAEGRNPSFAALERHVGPPAWCAPTQTGSALQVYKVYVGGSPALRSICARLGLRAFKVGITTKSPAARIAGLRDQCYAGLWGYPDAGRGAFIELDGADGWFQVPLSGEALQGQALPAGVALEEGALTFTLPGSVPAAHVGEALNAVLAGRSLRRLLASDPGQVRLRQAGCDTRAHFYTRYNAGAADERISVSREIFAIDPAREMAILVTGVEKMVAHLTRGACHEI